MGVLPHSLQLPCFEEDRKCGVCSRHADVDRAMLVSKSKVDTERRRVL
ncbi:hypothetical protein [Streptomyces sp. NPDC020996]